VIGATELRRRNNVQHGQATDNLIEHRRGWQ
jgi:hypothetical protein